MVSIEDCHHHAMIESFWGRLQARAVRPKTLELFDLKQWMPPPRCPMRSSGTWKSSITANDVKPPPGCAHRWSSNCHANPRPKINHGQDHRTRVTSHSLQAHRDGSDAKICGDLPDRHTPSARFLATRTTALTNDLGYAAWTQHHPSSPHIRAG